MDNNKQIVLAVGAVVFKNESILLVKRKNPPNQYQWALPGGKVNFSEPLKKAVAREILEETGIAIQVQEPIYTFEVISAGTNDTPALHYVIIDYTADYQSGDILAADDAEAAAWVDRNEFKEIDVNHRTKTLLHDKFNFP